VFKNTTSSPGNINENLQEENNYVLKDESLIALWWPRPSNPQNMSIMFDNSHNSNMNPQKGMY
jgi:hypothetical protein